MKIYIDADGCPVVYNVINIAKRYNINVVIVSNTAHIFNLESFDHVSKIICDKGKDVVDFTIINSINKKDIVVTQDYGLATMCLSKGCLPINQNGFWYTDKNIDKLLLTKYISSQERKIRKRNSKIKKRTKENDKNFEESLIKLIEKNLNQA